MTVGGSPLGSHQIPLLGDGFKQMFIFTPIPGEMIHFDNHIFQPGLVQPPTSFQFQWVIRFHTSKQKRPSSGHIGRPQGSNLKNLRSHHYLP